MPSVDWNSQEVLPLNLDYSKHSSVSCSKVTVVVMESSNNMTSRVPIEASAIAQGLLPAEPENNAARTDGEPPMGLSGLNMDQAYLEKEVQDASMTFNESTSPFNFNSEVSTAENGHPVRRNTLVHGMSGWSFPKGIADKSKFVSDSLRNGTDAKVIVSAPPSKASSPKAGDVEHPTTPPRRRRNTKRVRYDEKTLEENVIGVPDQVDRPLFGSPRSRRRVTENPTFEKKINPKATGVVFDSRFLKFAVAQDGSKKEEKLVWAIRDQSGNFVFHDSRDAILETIPDRPKRCNKSMSRVGPMYQARVPKSAGAMDNATDDEVPAYDKVWDPILAAAAEKEGQDIAGYLHIESKNLELSKTEFLMKLLHENNYNIERAEADARKVQNFRGSYKLDKHRELEDDWCSYKDGKCVYADDEHMLVVCDGCGRAYHLECARLDSIPSGKWFCPVCDQHFTSVSSEISGVKTRKEKALLHFSTTSSKA